MANIIPLTAAGEGRRTIVLGETTVTLVTRYNYSARCWSMDIIDTDDVLLAAGLMLVPGVNILQAHPSLTSLLGSFIIHERVVGDYQSPDKLGTDVVLEWIP